jgi:hypothetical protein
MKQVEKLVRAITLINDALEVTKTLGDDIQYPLLDCETAIYKKAKIIDLNIMNLDLKIDVLEDKISQQHKQKSEVQS